MFDCGTVTSKSLLSQAFSVSDVHLRPRKHFSRCTLDCGFKTSESPALRGFVAERGQITGTSLYLVIFSNGQEALSIDYSGAKYVRSALKIAAMQKSLF